MPCGGDLDFEVAGSLRYAVSILEDGFAIGESLAVVLKCDARFAEYAGEMTAERTRGHRAITDQFIDVARVEPGGPGPGVQFTALRHRHLQAHPVGRFKSKRIPGEGAAGGCIAADWLTLGYRRSFAWQHALIGTAVHGFDAYVPLEG